MSSLDLSAVESVIFSNEVRFVKFNPPVRMLLLVEFCAIVELNLKLTKTTAITKIKRNITTSTVFISNSTSRYS
jgi:hypothetical protein